MANFALYVQDLKIKTNEYYDASDDSDGDDEFVSNHSRASERCCAPNS